MDLAENILQQMNQMRQMGRTPTKLICDGNSFDVLLKEVMPSVVPYRQILHGYEPFRIYGLLVEISDTPNFEVV